MAINKHHYLKILCLVLPLIWTCWLRANTRMTAEGVAIRAIAYAARDYRILHRGLLATNWNQLSETRDIEGMNRSTYPIKEQYVFVSDLGIPMPDSQKGNVFLVRASPVTNEITGETGRYLIFRNGDDFVSEWIAETNMQKMLADAGVTELPKPEPFNPPSNHIPPAGVSRSRQEPQRIAPVVASNTSGHQGTVLVPDENFASKPSPTVEPDTNSVSLKSAATPSLKWLLLGVAVVLGGGFVFLLFRNKSR